MADCKKCRFRSICKKRPKTEGATIAECDLFRNDIERTEPMTNADHIRAMSDEELAELFGAIMREREIILLQKLREQGVEASIVEIPELTFNAQLEWLKQPAEE